MYSTILFSFHSLFFPCFFGSIRSQFLEEDAKFFDLLKIVKDGPSEAGGR